MGVSLRIDYDVDRNEKINYTNNSSNERLPIYEKKSFDLLD